MIKFLHKNSAIIKEFSVYLKRNLNIDCIQLKNEFFKRIRLDLKLIFFTLFQLIIFYPSDIQAQCGPFQIYEGFGSQMLPTQGTWTANGIVYTRTGIARSGLYAITFNGSGDYITTPLLATPKEFSFWYNGSSNTNASTFTIETSPNGTNWTPRATINSNVSAYTNYTINLAALGLTNIYVRIRDSRGSGTYYRYVDDVSWTSTNINDNKALIQGTPCNIQLTTGLTYRIYDNGGGYEKYNNNQTTSPITLLPQYGYIVRAYIYNISTETSFDFLNLYNGRTINDPILYSGSGTITNSYPVIPVTSFFSSDSSGALTFDLISDGSNTQDGFAAEIITIPTLPPDITSVTSSEVCGNSTKIVITGTYLNYITTATIGNLNLLPFDSISSTRLVKTITTPSNGIIYVSNNFGADSSSNSISFINSPSLSVDSTNIVICNGGSAIVNVTSNVLDYNSYSWSPSSGVSGTTSATFNPSTSKVYTLNAINSTTGCSNSLTRTVVVDSLNMPSPISIIQGNPQPQCFGAIDSLEVLGGIIPPSSAIILNENANSLPQSFNLVNISGIGTASLNTTYYKEGNGSVHFTTNSNFANISYESNSNLSLVGSDSAILSWSHIAALEGFIYSFDIGYVEYSTNAGNTWITFPNSSYRGTGTLITNQNVSNAVSGVVFSNQSYPDWISTFNATTSTPGVGPATSLWKDESILIPTSALSSSNFKIRFRYLTDNNKFYYGWLIDNIKIKRHYSNATFKWSPATTLYTNNTATLPYANTSIRKVFSKPQSNQKYYITASNGFCVRKDSIVDSIKSANSNLFLANANIAGAVEQCTDFDGWSYYALPSDPNKWLFGIYKNGYNFTASVDLNVNNSNKYSKKTSSNGANQEHSSYNLNRYWNVNATGTLGSGIKVRFLIDPQDTITLLNARDADYNVLKNVTNPNTLAVKSNFEWYKTIGMPYNPNNWIGNTHNIPIQKLIEDSVKIINGITCVELSGISSFSGGTGGAGFGPKNAAIIGLPVTWLSVNANANERGNIIEWITASEKNTSYFDVEYSYDGKTFEKVNQTKIIAMGYNSTKNSYSWQHVGAFQQEAFYRVKLIDLDNQEHFSNIVRINKNITDSPMAFIYPIPIQNETINLIIQSNNNAIFNISIADMLGKIVYSAEISHLKYNSAHQIHIDFLPKGIYAIHIEEPKNNFHKNINFIK